MEEQKQTLLAATPHSTDMPLHPCIPPSSHLLDTPLQSQLIYEQDRCATTAATVGDVDLEDLDVSSDLSAMQCHREMDADLDLSLGYGDHPGFMISSGRRGTKDRPRSGLIVLHDQTIDGPIAATAELPSTPCTNLADESSEGKDYLPCSRSSNHRLSSWFRDAISCPSFPVNGPLAASLHYGKVFFCKFCDRQFHSSQALGGHQNAHKRERLVARSTPGLLIPPFDYRSPQLLASRQPLLGHPALPPINMHMGADARKGFPSLALGCSTKPPMLTVPSMCKDAFQAPHHASTDFGHRYTCGGNAYIIGNRSLGIKVHSLVHKPATAAQALHMTPQMGHLKGQMVSIVGRGPAGMARRFATGIDCLRHGSLQTAARRLDHGGFTPHSALAASRFVCRTEEASGLLRRRPGVTQSHSPLPVCTQLDSSVASPSVDLGLHL